MNEKTAKAPHPPRVCGGFAPTVRGRWVRKSDLDEYRGFNLPLPTQIVSNEEFLPPPQSAAQKAVEQRLLVAAEAGAKKRGVSRREFLSESCGMATAFAAMNTVFGSFFRVEGEELFEPAARLARLPGEFVFDVQTHHVAVGRGAIVLPFRQIAEAWNPALRGHTHAVEEVYLQNYVKEIFLDSETDMVVLSGFPGLTEETNILPPEQIARSRAVIDGIAGSQRVLAHGLIIPDLGAQNLESMHAQAERLKLNAWKGYTGVPRAAGGEGWWLDDEKVAYPTYQYARKAGIRNICVHKGLPLEGFNVEHCHPKDVAKAASDFPDLNFLIYHSGFKGLPLQELPAIEKALEKDPYVPWVSDLCAMRRKNPKLTNVYMELGSTFGITVISHPLLSCHVLGMILDAFGEDHVLWGTDSIWWGSPQWQIEALRRLQMPEALTNRFGYKPLTTAIKLKILGGNAARLHGIDPKAKRAPIPGDIIDRLRKEYRESNLATPSGTQYGWVATR